MSVAVVYIESTIDNVNESMPKISDSIVQGDKDYNESVELLNTKYFDQSREKAISAGDNYNSSLHSLQSIKDQYYKDLNEVHKDYIDTTIKELELKLKAVENLRDAIYYLEMEENYTGSDCGSYANEIMYEALNYQNERNGIVQNNSKLFS